MNEGISRFLGEGKIFFGDVTARLRRADLRNKFGVANNFFLSHVFLACEAAVGAFMFHYGASVPAIAFFGSVFVLSLFLCDDLTTLTPPLMFASMAVLKSYGATFEDFASLVPLVVFLALGFAFHFIFYRPKHFRFGRQGGAVSGVAFAILMGGAGIIKTQNYYEGSTLYYILGLSFGAALTYFVLRNYVKTDNPVKMSGKIRSEGAIYYFARVMCYVAVMGGVMLFFEAILPALEEFGGEVLWYVQWKNNLATFMLLALPFPFMLAAKSKYGVIYFALGLAAGVVCCFTLSRGGMLFGGLMSVVCVAACLWRSKGKTRLLYIAMTLAAVAALVAFAVVCSDFVEQLIGNINVSSNEARAKMYRLAIENFNRFPFFGTGLGYKGDFYHPQEIAMYWYHSTPFQVIGSMGILGIAAYMYQLYNRVDVMFEKFGTLNIFLFLAFTGFELMSLVNPGDFCPVPYVMVLIHIVTLAELYNTRDYDYETRDFRRAGRRVFTANQTLYGGQIKNAFWKLFGIFGAMPRDKK